MENLIPKVYSKRKTTPAEYRNPPPDAMLVDRTTQWGNPFIIGRDGTHEQVVGKFKIYALDRLRHQPDWLEPLRGKDLVCWCAPESCHADVLLHLANDRSNQ